MWDEMYEEFWDKLEHFCARLCRDESRAEDLAQVPVLFPVPIPRHKYR